MYTHSHANFSLLTGTHSRVTTNHSSQRTQPGPTIVGPVWQDFGRIAVTRPLTERRGLCRLLNLKQTPDYRLAALYSRRTAPCWDCTVDAARRAVRDFPSSPSSAPTFAIAFLYRMAACSIRLQTFIFPSPHGTTTRVLPKHTVTFISPPLPR